MRKIIYTLLTFCSLCSCSTLKINASDIAGDFYKEESSKNYLSIVYDLKLKPDSTFSLSIKTRDANPTCKGLWKLKKNYIYLKCQESQDVGKILSSSYMKELNYELKLINRNNIKFNEDIILRRK